MLIRKASSAVESSWARAYHLQNEAELLGTAFKALCEGTSIPFLSLSLPPAPWQQRACPIPWRSRAPSPFLAGVAAAPRASSSPCRAPATEALPLARGLSVPRVRRQLPAVPRGNVRGDSQRRSCEGLKPEVHPYVSMNIMGTEDPSPPGTTVTRWAAG